MKKSVLIIAPVAALLVAAASLPGLSTQGKTHLGGKASGLLTFFANASVGSTVDLQQILPDGSLGSFTLPENSVLVVTDLIASVNGTPVAGVTRGSLVAPSMAGGFSLYYSFDATQLPHHGIHLTSGSVWSVVPRVLNANDSKNSVFVEVHGYLAKDK